MTDRQMRHMISHAIAAAQPAAEKYYHVCWWEEAVRCRHVRHATERHEVFYMALGFVFRDGSYRVVRWNHETQERHRRVGQESASLRECGEA